MLKGGGGNRRDCIWQEQETHGRQDMRMEFDLTDKKQGKAKGNFYVLVE